MGRQKISDCFILPRQTCARITSSRIGYNAWRCVEAGPVLLVWRDDAKLHAGARAENGSPRCWKRCRRACEA